MTKQIALSALIIAPGNSRSPWRHPEVDPASVNSIEDFVAWAQTAERGLFDLFFIADTTGARYNGLDVLTQSPHDENRLEPLSLLSAVSMATQHIGLGGTVSTSWHEPFNIARNFASLDWISHGRAAWNVVTSADHYSFQNFGLEQMPPHADRYGRAEESLELVKEYWDTWEDDAFIFDKEGARNYDPDKFHLVDHKGRFFTARGGLPIARSPQGHPVIIQAGASEVGREMAAKSAEIVFGVSATLDRATAFYADVKGRMEKYGREPDELKILAGVQVFVGKTETEAQEKARVIKEIVPIEARLARLAEDLEADLSGLPLDEPIPADRIPEKANLHQGYFRDIVDYHDQGHTLREVALWYERSTSQLVGDPVQIADILQSWVDAGACDGFMFSIQWLPGNLDDLVDLLVPELQKRGMVRTEYAGTTLRENLGLARPANRYVAVQADQ